MALADVAHLERMCRELKCPICLSLLSSAVSLTCNHVFCNLCIGKSMKSDSNCPVCKTPYQRREIRPAPHMDNLVSIYKSMEVASGVNISVTQTDPSTKLSGEKNKKKSNVACQKDKTEKTCKGTSKGKMSKRSFKYNSKISRENIVKPSFPAKKRVQVPQHPQLETPMRPRKPESGKIEQIKDGTQGNSPVTKDRSGLNENGETMFAPFFWLRNEKDPEELTQQTDGESLLGTPPDAPCFSDMKDSDNERDCDNTTMSAPRAVSHNIDIFDSEMFEWTQRPCSPELYSSPMKTEVRQTNRFDGIQDLECKGTSRDAVVDWQLTVEKGDNVAAERAIAEMEVTVSTVSSREANTRNNDGKTKRTKKRTSEASRSTQRKRMKRVTDVVPGIHNDLQNGAGSNIQERKSGNNCKPVNLKVTCKKDKKVRVYTTSTEALTVKVCNLSNDDETRIPYSCLKTKENVVKNLKIQKCSKTVKFSTGDNSEVRVTKSIHGDVEENSNVRAEVDSSEMEKTSAKLSAVFLRKCDAASNIQCVFCQSTEGSNVSGIMVHYLNGKPVAADYGGLGIIHAHKECAEWAPNVYFEDDTAINLEAELSRSRRIKCCCCGVKGAALGCYEKSCHRSFHFPCAKLTPQCRWDNENFVMLCPLHKSLALPYEGSDSQLKQNKKCVLKRQSHIVQSKVAVSCGISTTSRWNSQGLFKKMVISCSAFTSEDKETVREFEKLSGVTVLKAWDSSVTHVITSTDENGASKRTLKFLMGILEGKWILSIEWVKACMKVKEPVGEQDYEISSDVHGIRDGPRLGRLRLLIKQPKLFSGYKLYFTGDFVPSYKGYLHDLIIAAGGTVLNRKPLSLDQEIQSRKGSITSQTLLIYSLELPNKCSPNKNLILKKRRSDAEALARSTGALAVSNKWILNSIAACKLQNFNE